MVGPRDTKPHYGASGVKHLYGSVCATVNQDIIYTISDNYERFNSCFKTSFWTYSQICDRIQFMMETTMIDLQIQALRLFALNTSQNRDR